MSHFNRILIHSLLCGTIAGAFSMLFSLAIITAARADEQRQQRNTVEAIRIAFNMPSDEIPMLAKKTSQNEAKAVLASYLKTGAQHQ